MDTVQSSQSTCHRSTFACGAWRPATMKASFHGIDRWSARSTLNSARSTLNLVLFCLIMLAGSPARGQSETDDRLAPHDTVLVHVAGWTALRGGVGEASVLSDAFTIGTAGTLELPIIGPVPAAGLTAHELAKLIADRLHARSGLRERPVTTVQRKHYLPLHVRGSVERPGKYPYRPNLTIEDAIEIAGGLARVEGLEETATQLTLSISRRPGLVPELNVSTNSLVFPGNVIWVQRTPVPEAPQGVSTERSSSVTSEPISVEGHPPAAKPNLNRPRTPVKPAVTEYQQALEQEGSRKDALLRDLSAARLEALAVRRQALAAREAAHGDAVLYKQRLAAERQRTTNLTQELSAAWADREALKARMAQDVNAASQARKAAEALVNDAHELAARERAKSAALEQKLVAARKEIDAVKNSAQTAADGREEVLRRELTAAREELDAMRRAARDASARVYAVADTTAEQGRALEGQRQRAERLVRNLTAAQREVANLKAKGDLAIREKAAAFRARHATEVSLAEARRALDEERQKVGHVERDLAAARQSRDALEASVKLATAARATAVQGQQVAETAAKQAGEALALAHARTDALARDLKTARRERDSAKEEVTRLMTALEQERRKAVGLAHELAVARTEIEDLKARATRVEPAPKPGVTNPARPRVGALGGKRVQSARRSKGREIRKVEVRKPSRPVRLTSLALPAALLPTRPPLRAGQRVW
jgi:protein involved in polysaccharide export with SLBB domain